MHPGCLTHAGNATSYLRHGTPRFRGWSMLYPHLEHAHCSLRTRYLVRRTQSWPRCSHLLRRKKAGPLSFVSACR